MESFPKTRSESHAAERPLEHRELFTDANLNSFIFRRHSEWAGRGTITEGALTGNGIRMAREKAEEVATQIRSLREELRGKEIDLAVELYESPSAMPAANADKEPNPAQQRRVGNIRASQTGSVYEKAIFGNLLPPKDPELLGKESGRRKRDALLGDLLEGVDHIPEKDRPAYVKNIPLFFQARAKAYGKDMEWFWNDFVSDTLDADVKEKLLACGGYSSKDLAHNFTEFLESGREQDQSEEEHKTKHLAVAISHNETLRSFLYHLSKFIPPEDQEQAAAVAQYASKDFNYNTGFDVRIGHDGMATVTLSNSTTVTVSLDDFKKFLELDQKA